MRPTIDEEELHDNPVYPKLNRHYKRLLKEIAAQNDIPENVFARQLLVKGLQEHIKLMQQALDSSLKQKK